VSTSLAYVTDEELDDIPPTELAPEEDSGLSADIKLRRRIEYALLTLAWI